MLGYSLFHFSTLSADQYFWGPFFFLWNNFCWHGHRFLKHHMWLQYLFSSNMLNFGLKYAWVKLMRKSWFCEFWKTIKLIEISVVETKICPLETKNSPFFGKIEIFWNVGQLMDYRKKLGMKIFTCLVQWFPLTLNRGGWLGKRKIGFNHRTDTKIGNVIFEN